MFIGNDNVTSGGNIDIQAESAGFMDPVEEALHNVAVDEANYNQILGCLAVAEVTAAHKGLDPASVYTEGTISDFWGKIKEFFKKIWAKIKGLWAKLVATFDQHAKSGKEFFDKYKKTLADKFTKIDKDKIKFSGYNFSGKGAAAAVSVAAVTTGLDVNTIVNGFNNNVPDDDAITDMEESYRGTLINHSGSSYTLKEMVKELHDDLRDGGTKDNDIDVTFTYISAALANSDKEKSDFDKLFRSIEKAMNKNIKDAEKAQDTNIKNAANTPSQANNDTVSKYSKAIRYLKSCLGSIQAAAAEIVKAMKDEISQAKGFAAQVLRAGVRDGFKEGAGVSSGVSGNSIFGSVKLA